MAAISTAADGRWELVDVTPADIEAATAAAKARAVPGQGAMIHAALLVQELTILAMPPDAPAAAIAAIRESQDLAVEAAGMWGWLEPGAPDVLGFPPTVARTAS